MAMMNLGRTTLPPRNVDCSVANRTWQIYLKPKINKKQNLIIYIYIYIYIFVNYKHMYKYIPQIHIPGGGSPAQPRVAGPGRHALYCVYFLYILAFMLLYFGMFMLYPTRRAARSPTYIRHYRIIIVYQGSFVYVIFNVSYINVGGIMKDVEHSFEHAKIC